MEISLHAIFNTTSLCERCFVTFSLIQLPWSFLPCSFASVLLHVMRRNLKLCCWIQNIFLAFALPYFIKSKKIYISSLCLYEIGSKCVSGHEHHRILREHTEYGKQEKYQKHNKRWQTIDKAFAVQRASRYNKWLCTLLKIYYQLALVNDFKFEGKMMQWE